jgi:hypothetical protein
MGLTTQVFHHPNKISIYINTYFTAAPRAK